MRSVSSTPEQIARAVACAREHAQAAQLAAFAYELFGQKCAAKSASVGQLFVQDAAREHAVDRETARCDGADLLTIAEREPSNGYELALFAAFATLGFGAACLAAAGGKRRELARALVRDLGWLELATPYRLTPFLGLLLPAEARGLVEEELLAAVLAEDEARDVDPATRARNAARLTTLARIQADAAQAALGRARDRGRDPATRAIAAALLGISASEHPGVKAHSVRGLERAPARRLPIAILRWVSGIALLSAAYRLLCFLLALRHEAELVLEGGLLRVSRRTTFLGRSVRSSEAAYAVDRVTGALRRARYALLRTAIGVASLSFGVLLGAHLLFDGARGGAPLLLLAGASVVLLGAALDLGLEILLPGRAGQVELQVDLEGARSVRLSRVPLDDADRLLEALADRVALATVDTRANARPTLHAAPEPAPTRSA